MPTDVYWQFAYVAKKARRIQEGRCSRGQPVLEEGQPGQRVPRCLAPVEPRCAPFPGPGASCALSKRGCLLMPGLAAFFVPLTFSFLYARPFYGGFKGAGTPLPAPGRPGLLPRLVLTSWGCPPSTSGWPARTAAVPPNHSLFPHLGVFLLFFPKKVQSMFPSDEYMLAFCSAPQELEVIFLKTLLTVGRQLLP